jgi:hypothetical protein
MSRQAGARRGGSGGLGGPQGFNATASLVAAAVAVILGFFILRDINNDSDTGGGAAVPETTLVTDTTLAGATTGRTHHRVQGAGRQCGRCFWCGW